MTSYPYQPVDNRPISVDNPQPLWITPREVCIPTLCGQPGRLPYRL